MGQHVVPYHIASVDRALRSDEDDQRLLYRYAHLPAPRSTSHESPAAGDSCAWARSPKRICTPVALQQESLVLRQHEYLGKPRPFHPYDMVAKYVYLHALHRPTIAYLFPLHSFRVVTGPQYNPILARTDPR